MDYKEVCLLSAVIFLAFNQLKLIKRYQGLIIKSIDNNNSLIIVSFGWFYLSLFYVGMFYLYACDMTYENVEFGKIYVPTMYGLVGVYWLIRGVLKDVINERGIFTSKGNYKWNRLANYEWGTEREMKIKKDHIQYYELILYLRRNKIARLFTDEKYKEVIFKIDTDYKDKVQKFLEDILEHL